MGKSSGGVLADSLQEGGGRSGDVEACGNAVIVATGRRRGEKGEGF